MINHIDKKQARMAFSRAANTYDAAAVLQKEIGQRMIERLELVMLQPSVILDVGAGTGVAAGELAKRYRKSKVIALDFSLPMLRHARKRGPWLRRPKCVCADLEQLPIADKSVDLLYSNVAIQWANDIEKTFSEFRRVLKPSGLLMFSTFGPDTLKELRAAWSTVDGYSHVSQFIDMHDLGDALLRAKFADPVMDVDRMMLTYENVGGLMRDLKQIGAHNVTHERQKGLTGKDRFKAMQRSYESYRRDGTLPASYEVVYGHAWAPEHEAQQQEDGVINISIDQIGRMSS